MKFPLKKRELLTSPKLQKGKPEEEKEVD